MSPSRSCARDLLSDPDSRERFRRESQIVARLQHPSIVTVFDYGTLADGAAFLVMEFVPGEDLRHLLKRERQLAPERAVELMSGIAGGVESAHKAGILHRDLKPENILLPESGTGPKVVDFGVAKLSANPAGGGASPARSRRPAPSSARRPTWRRSSCEVRWSTAALTCSAWA